MGYKVVISPYAKRQLELFIGYTEIVLRNNQATKAIREDAIRTKRRLSNNPERMAICRNEKLAVYGYRRIFFENYDFFMVYRIEGNLVIVDAMYHELQDYENVFSQKMGL